LQQTLIWMTDTWLVDADWSSSCGRYSSTSCSTTRPLPPTPPSGGILRAPHQPRPPPRRVGTRTRRPDLFSSVPQGHDADRSAQAKRGRLAPFDHGPFQFKLCCRARARATTLVGDWSAPRINFKLN
jgi:hypothetical protein